MEDGVSGTNGASAVPRVDSEGLKFKGENVTIQHLPMKVDLVKECRATRDHASLLSVVSINW